MHSAIVALCRAGFETETAADLAAMGAARSSATVSGSGYVVANLEAQDEKRWRRARAEPQPVFARTWFTGTGPHRIVGEKDRGRADRVTPIVEAALELRWAPFRSVWVEFPDTNEGKALSTLARALETRIADAMARRELIDDAAPARLRVFLVDGSLAYVGISDASRGSPWPMGIPRLRMPHGAPSRSTLKLAEAFVTFLGDRESTLLRPGQRAVDLGAAPGGWTWQLARRGLRVIAVDNGALKGDVANDPLVTHVRADAFAWRPRRSADWLVCDVVEQPKRIAALVAGWIARGDARRAIFNLKLPMKKRYDEVLTARATISESLRRAGVRFTLAIRQLYHDREEVTAYVAREN